MTEERRNEYLELSRDIGKVAAHLEGVAATTQSVSDRLHEFIDYQHSKNHDVVNFMQKIDGRSIKHEERYSEIKSEASDLNDALRKHMDDEEKTVRKIFATVIVWLVGTLTALIAYIWNAQIGG